MQIDSPEFSALVTGIPGAEGPCVSSNGRIFMVSSGAGSILEILPDGNAVELANTGGIPAGLQLNRDGSLLVADMKLGILRVTMSGAVQDVVRNFAGVPIRGCNDLAFDTRGNLYFTAPQGSSNENPCGELFCRKADGEVFLLDNGFAFSNGLAVSADDKTLIVAETFSKKLFSYEIIDPGEVSGKRVFATLSGEGCVGPDGMDFDADGNLVATNLGSGFLDIFDPAGSLIRRVSLPFKKPSNVHFSGPDSHLMLVTEHSTYGLWQFDYGMTGQLQYGWTN